MKQIMTIIIINKNSIFILLSIIFFYDYSFYFTKLIKLDIYIFILILIYKKQQNTSVDFWNTNRALITYCWGIILTSIKGYFLSFIFFLSFFFQNYLIFSFIISLPTCTYTIVYKICKYYHLLLFFYYLKIYLIIYLIISIYMVFVIIITSRIKFKFLS